MSTLSSLKLDPESVARLDGLEVRARHVVEGFLSGQHRSLHRGHSVEFAEHREYSAGDDLRYVDWKAFGKTDRVYLKQFEAETNLSCYVLLDISESMHYRGPDSAMSKLQYAQCLAASLAYLLVRQRDSIGLATFDDRLREFVVSGAGPAIFERIVRVLDQKPSAESAECGRGIAEAAARLRRRALVIVISDLLGSPAEIEQSLARLRHDRHEVVVMHTLDPAELDLPFSGTTLFRCLESGPALIAEPRAIRSNYLKVVKQFLEQVQSYCRTSRADYELASTHERLDAPLRRLLAARSRRR